MLYINNHHLIVKPVGTTPNAAAVASAQAAAAAQAAPEVNRLYTYAEVQLQIAQALIAFQASQNLAVAPTQEDTEPSKTEAKVEVEPKTEAEERMLRKKCHQFQNLQSLQYMQPLWFQLYLQNLCEALLFLQLSQSQPHLAIHHPMLLFIPSCYLATFSRCMGCVTTSAILLAICMALAPGALVWWDVWLDLECASCSNAWCSAIRPLRNANSLFVVSFWCNVEGAY